MFKKYQMHFAAFAFSICASSSNANPDWNWYFTTPSIDLSKSTVVSAIIENSPQSDGSIFIGGLLLESFGYFGLLYEANFRGIITPTVLPINGEVQPGAYAKGGLIDFYISDQNPPTPGVTYEVRPSFTVWYGSNCNLANGMSGCTVSTKSSDRNLLVTFAPVPEPSSFILLAVGGALLIGGTKLRRQ